MSKENIKSMTRLGVVAHDAGAAYLIAHWIQANKVKPHFALMGPALPIFQNLFGQIENQNINNVIQRSSQILIGSGWQSTFELEAINLCRSKEKHSIVMIDHWVNYTERFLYNDKLILPDELWVVDEYALALAEKNFKGIPIRKVLNHYQQFISQKINKLASTVSTHPSRRKRILYFSENISSHALTKHGDPFFFGYNDFTALQYLLTNIKSVTGHTSPEIVVRLHPSELASNYDDFYSSIPLSISNSVAKTIYDDINEADVITGCESAALSFALLSHKPVISVIPPGTGKCSLPHREILHLKDLA